MFDQNEYARKYIKKRRRKENYYEMYETDYAKFSEETEYRCIDCGRKIIHYYDEDQWGRIYRFRNRFRCKMCWFFLKLDMRRGTIIENRTRCFFNREQESRINNEVEKIDYFGGV